MAQQVIYDAIVTVNGVTLTTKCTKATVNMGQESKDNTAFSFVSRSKLPGIGDHSIECTFVAERGAGTTEATLRALLGPTVSPFAVTVKHKSGATAADNPLYTMAAAILDGGFKPIDGSVGDLETYAVKFSNAGPLGIVVTTA